ncbi:YdaE family protein [Enterobacter sp.]|uniref:YdaE family protein n=1 Tax=Enterobacter sp. TaxID=42895 RepID=UPI00296EAE6F|nr:YdaE family protein [Enterobacter sp.]
MQEKECAYCRKPIEQRKEVKNKLLLIRGAQLAHEQREYCSVRCASYDQMAHEA